VWKKSAGKKIKFRASTLTILPGSSRKRTHCGLPVEVLMCSVIICSFLINVINSQFCIYLM
jgi:hypothetical protein